MQEILIDGTSKKGGLLTGRTRGNRTVNVAASPSLIGSLVSVTITAPAQIPSPAPYANSLHHPRLQNKPVRDGPAADELASQGNTIVPFDEQADVYIINTCSVTAKSDYQCRQIIRAAARRAEGAKVIVTGCYASTRPGELEKIPGVQWVVKNEEKQTIPARHHESAGGSRRGTPFRVSSRPGNARADSLRSRTAAITVVPTASFPMPEVVREAWLPKLSYASSTGWWQSGCPEIVLTGIHVGMYGADLGPGVSLSELIRSLVQRRSTARIRLSSIEPNEITDEMIGFLGKGVCRHLHIPLQSGDDGILSVMKRKYSSSFYKDLLKRISGQVPEIALGADVIVGFPG